MGYSPSIDRSPGREVLARDVPEKDDRERGKHREPGHEEPDPEHKERKDDEGKERHDEEGKRQEPLLPPERPHRSEPLLCGRPSEKHGKRDDEERESDAHRILKPHGRCSNRSTRASSSRRITHALGLGRHGRRTGRRNWCRVGGQAATRVP